MTKITIEDSCSLNKQIFDQKKEILDLKGYVETLKKKLKIANESVQHQAKGEYMSESNRSATICHICEICWCSSKDRTERFQS